MKKPAPCSAKRSRVTDLRRESYATTRSVAVLLKRAKEEGIPEYISASTQHRYRRAECARDTPYGPLVREIDIPETSVANKIAIQNPFAMLHVCVSESDAFAEIFMGALAEYGLPSPERPWRLIFYQDEVGISPLDGVDTRKTVGCYWSFVEFGRRLLCTENAWFVICAIRTSIVKELDGGTSYLCKILLRMLLTGTEFSFRTGILLHIRGRSDPVLLFAELALKCADLDGIFKFCLSLGANANVPCPLCMNIVSIRSKYALAGNALRAFDCLDKGDVIYHTDETIRETLKKLRCTARYSPENLAEMQTDCGYSHHEENILLDEELNIGFASIAHLDWFHTWLQTGIFNYELAALMLFLAADPSCKITYEDIGAFVENYETAKALPKVSHLFHANCVSKESVHFKCSASEALTLYPILALYFAEVVTACEPQRRSFLALCDVLDLLVCTKEGWQMVPPDMLDDAIVKHFRLMKSTYGVMFWTLKFHAAAMHIARQYRKHGLLVSLFTHERRHKLLKRFIRDRPNTTSFERGVMEEVTLQHLYDVRSKWWKSGCIDLRPPGKSLRAAW